MDLVEFENGALAVMSYSSMYHGRALGRKSKTLFQVDGTTGTIVEDDVHTTTEAQRLNGGRASVCPIRTEMREMDGMQVLDRMVVESGPAAGVGESVAPVPDVSWRVGDRGRDGQYRQRGSGRSANPI